MFLNENLRRDLYIKNELIILRLGINGIEIEKT